MSALMVFQYTASFILFQTERYAVIGALLYIDRWLKYEYIIDTNAVVCVVVASLLVHEMRDAGVQERIHHPRAHDVVLTALVVCNMIVLAFGESFHGSTPNGFEEIAWHWKRSHTGPLLWLLGICGILVMLSTCAMPTSSQDASLNNIRVTVFTLLCLSWFFSVNHMNLTYTTVAPFTPCVLRFSSVLFLPSLLWAFVGTVMLTAGLTATNLRIGRERGPSSDDCHTNRDKLDRPVETRGIGVNCSRSRSPNTPLENRQSRPVAVGNSRRNSPLPPPESNAQPRAGNGYGVGTGTGGFHVGFHTTPSLRTGISKSSPEHTPGEHFIRVPVPVEQVQQQTYQVRCESRSEHPVDFVMSPTTATNAALGISGMNAGFDYNSLFEQASLDHVA